jgi:hypothetical protein
MRCFSGVEYIGRSMVSVLRSQWVRSRCQHLGDVTKLLLDS